jgi:hypothetical protein
MLLVLKCSSNSPQIMHAGIWLPPAVAEAHNHTLSLLSGLMVSVKRMATAGLGKALSAVLVLVMLYGMITPSLALQCYVTYTKDASTPPETSTQVLAADDMQTGYFCTRFQVKGKWSYGFTDASSCALMKQNPETYKNLVCCDTPLCNAPDKALDPVTTIVPSLPGAIGRK